ncbi:DUF5063 domain-containing protein [Gaoshiqia sp. Z1-71]|uniref:DUF5063 domain-containing protein n=1 Tax=Gaoshiqia hydrogeniformans TaxID=3290090 RepID=UPI003BF7B444
MTDDGLNPLVYSRDIIEFVTVSNEYCRFVENAGSENPRDLLGKIQKILPLLYLKASVLPEFDSTEELVLEKYVTEVDYNFLQQRIMNLLGEHDDYQEIFDPEMQYSDAPLTSSISENLADIYQDLKDFIMLYRTGDELVMQEALWECLNNFKNYWGQKLVNGLRAIHALIYSQIDFNQEIKLGHEEDEENTKPDWLNNLFNNQID